MFSLSSCVILFIVCLILIVYPGFLCKVWDREPFLDDYPFVPSSSLQTPLFWEGTLLYTKFLYVFGSILELCILPYIMVEVVILPHGYSLSTLSWIVLPVYFIVPFEQWKTTKPPSKTFWIFLELE